MTHYSAVMLGEDGMEFHAEVEADSYGEASEKLAENYPESRVIQLETPQDIEERQQRLYAAIHAEYDDGYDDYDYDDED